MRVGLLGHRLIMFHVKRETVTLVVGAILAVVTRSNDPIGNLSFLDAIEHSVGLLDAIGAAGGPLAVICARFHRPGDAEFGQEPIPRGRDGGVLWLVTKGHGKSGHLPVAQADIKQVEDFALYGDKQTLTTELANGAKSQPGDSGGPLMTDGRDSVLLLPQKA